MLCYSSGRHHVGPGRGRRGARRATGPEKSFPRQPPLHARPYHPAHPRLRPAGPTPSVPPRPCPRSLPTAPEPPPRCPAPSPPPARAHLLCVCCATCWQECVCRFQHREARRETRSPPRDWAIPPPARCHARWPRGLAWARPARALGEPSAAPRHPGGGAGAGTPGCALRRSQTQTIRRAVASQSRRESGTTSRGGSLGGSREPSGQPRRRPPSAAPAAATRARPPSHTYMH